MAITSSVVITDRAQADGTRKISEVHTDSLGKTYPRYFNAASGYDAAAGLLVGAADINATLIKAEISAGIAEYEAGTDPLHDEITANNWQKITPVEQTWDELATAVTVNFLERKDRNDLHYLESIINRISGNDKKALWGMTTQEANSVNTEIQNAVNAMVELDAYAPFFVDGEKV